MHVDPNYVHRNIQQISEDGSFHVTGKTTTTTTTQMFAC